MRGSLLNPRDIKTRFLRSFAARRVDIALDAPVASITFDDVPRSAYDNGLPVLDRFGVRATFYVAMGLTDEAAAGEGLHLSRDQIVDLHRRGHEIGCHTYSHYRLDAGSARGLVADADRNVAALRGLLGDVPVRNFSYPFGQVNFELKRRLTDRYQTMRSSRPGVNARATDLSLLLATSIYDGRFSTEAMNEVIAQARREGGWLVFYTHGVSAAPGAYDCTPEQLAWVIERCLESGFRLLPIADACGEIAAPRR